MAKDVDRRIVLDPSTEWKHMFTTKVFLILAGVVATLLSLIDVLIQTAQ